MISFFINNSLLLFINIMNKKFKMSVIIIDLDIISKFHILNLYLFIILFNSISSMFLIWCTRDRDTSVPSPSVSDLGRSRRHRLWTIIVRMVSSVFSFVLFGDRINSTIKTSSNLPCDEISIEILRQRHLDAKVLLTYQILPLLFTDET